MSMTPLDLQILFSQVEKFSKEVHAQKEGAQLRKVIENDHQQKTETEKSKTVNEASNNDNTLMRLNEDGGQDAGEQEKRRQNEEKTEDKKLLVKDPNLGRYLDLKG